MIGGMRIDDNGMGEAMDQFLRRTNFKDSYSAAVGDKSRFNIDLDQLRDFDPKLTQYIIKNPVKGIQLFEDRVNKLLSELNDNISSEKAKLINPSNFPVKCKSLKLNFDGNYGKNFVTPRGLKSSMINSLVKVQGIVTRMSIVKPKLSKSYHYIPATKQGYVQEYKDQYSVEGQGNFSSKLFPTKDAAGNLMVAEYGYCNYTDVQKLIIQEMPERTPTGQIPRSVMVFLEDDLVDRVKPGDRVEITGVFKCVSTASSSTSGVFKTIVVGTGIKAISDKSDKIKITPEDIKNIKYVSTRKDIFGVLASSIAPTVQGHINIKKSMILQLMGGTEKNLQDGGHLRGDINILLIGDPSTAKSQMLRHALNLAPIAINTTGRGSSGVGLTAAVTIDKETGERHLEAGAMVLADKGLVCIDEFDKMDDGDRVAIHEVMEQQTVTIAKAGIHASLNARCSVIAAANPIYGDYDRTIPAAKNIGLSDTLLSRFDLLFVVLDEKNPTVDKKIAERVIRNHTFKDENKGFVFNLFQDEFHIEPELPNEDEIEKETQIYEKGNSVLFGNISHDIVTTPFLKKYISYAKKASNPTLNDDAIDFIAQAYKSLRQKAQDVQYANQKKLPVTVRSLETLIRLATAHSKLRINNEGMVTTDDLQVALKLMNFAIFDEDDDEEGGEEDVQYQDKQETVDDSESVEEPRMGRRKPRKTGQSLDTVIDLEEEDDEERIDTKPQKKNKKKLKVDDVQQVRNLVDFSANSKEDMLYRERKKLVYTLLSKKQKDEVFDLNYDQIWNIISSKPETLELMGSKENLIQIVHAFEKSNQVLITDDGAIVLI